MPTLEGLSQTKFLSVKPYLLRVGILLSQIDVKPLNSRYNSHLEPVTIKVAGRSCTHTQIMVS